MQGRSKGAALFYGVCGKTEAAREAVTDWLENTVRVGNINYPFWAQHNEWVDSVRGHSRFDTIMRDVEREWMSVTSIS